VAFLAIHGGIDHIARVAQRLLQEALQIGIIFDKQNTHALSSTMPAVTSAAITTAIITTATLIPIVPTAAIAAATLIPVVPVTTTVATLIPIVPAVAIVAPIVAAITAVAVGVIVVAELRRAAHHLAGPGIDGEPDDPPVGCHPFNVIGGAPIGRNERTFRVRESSGNRARDLRQNTIQGGPAAPVLRQGRKRERYQQQ
jgi:hypothetical protein